MNGLISLIAGPTAIEGPTANIIETQNVQQYVDNSFYEQSEYTYIYELINFIEEENNENGYMSLEEFTNHKSTFIETLTVYEDKSNISAYDNIFTPKYWAENTKFWWSGMHAYMWVGSKLIYDFVEMATNGVSIAAAIAALGIAIPIAGAVIGAYIAANIFTWNAIG